MAGSDQMRLFVAVPLPAALKTAASAVQQQVARLAGPAGWRVSWTPPENLHLTLKFLGSTPAVRLDAIRSVLDEATDHPPFELRLAGLGSFPPVGRPRVLWVGVEEGARDLGQIARRLEAGFEPLGFSPESRRFHPHLTLGRVKDGRARAEDVLAPVREAEVGALRVDEVRLYQSHLSASGAEHAVVHTSPLGGSKGGPGANG
jgi:2'-5' RNA ligase